MLIYLFKCVYKNTKSSYSPHTFSIFFSPYQEQTSRVQTQLNEEELKNSKLLQQIAKLEEQITVISQESVHKDEVEFLLVPHLLLSYQNVFLFDVWVFQKNMPLTQLLIFLILLHT